MHTRISFGEGLGERLERYLLGQLTEAEQTETEVWFFGDAERLEDLAMAEGTLIEKYLFGELDSQQRHLFKSNFLTTKERVEDLRFQSTLEAYVSKRFSSRMLSLHEQSWRDVKSEVRHTTLRQLANLSRELLRVRSFRLPLVRFARWAGWLHFVDSELLNDYIRHQNQNRA